MFWSSSEKQRPQQAASSDLHPTLSNGDACPPPYTPSYDYTPPLKQSPPSTATTVSSFTTTQIWPAWTPPVETVPLPSPRSVPSNEVPSYQMAAHPLAPAPPRPLLTFPIHYDSKFNKTRLTIFTPVPSPDALTPLYYVAGRGKNAFSSRPDMLIHRGGSKAGPVMASCDLHTWSTTVDIVYTPPLAADMPATTTLKQYGLMSRAHTVVVANRRLVWKGSRGSHLVSSPDLKLVDENAGMDRFGNDASGGEVYAVLHRDRDSTSKRFGYFEIWKDGLSQGAIDQCVVTGMAMLHQEIQNRKSGAASSAGGISAGMGAVGGGC